MSTTLVKNGTIVTASDKYDADVYIDKGVITLIGQGLNLPADAVVDDTGETDASFSLFEELHQPFLLWWSNPEKEFLNKLLREDLERAVDALPETFRTVVVLAELEGLTGVLAVRYLPVSE